MKPSPTQYSIMIAAGALVLLPTLAYPIGEDQAIFGYIARRMLAGDVLYRDVWDHKLGIYFLYEWIFGIIGDSVPSIRAFDIIWTIATSFMLYHLGRAFVSPVAALSGGVFYIILYGDSSYWGMAQPDGFANLFVVAALLLWIRGSTIRWADFLSGLCLGAALSLRPSLITVAVCLPFVCKAFPPPRSVAKATIFTCVGLVVGLAPFALYFVTRGQTSTLWESFVLANIRYSAIRSSPFWEEMMRGIVIGFTHANMFVLICGCIGLLYVLSSSRSDGRLRVLLVYYVAAVASVFVQGKFFSYHWIATYAPFALLAGSVVDLRKELVALPGRRRRLMMVGYALVGGVLISPFLLSMAERSVAAVRVLSNSELSREYYSKFPPEPGKAITPYSFRYIVEEDVARHIALHTTGEDRIVVWGFSPLVYYLAERRAPTRFFDPKVLFWEGIPREWQAEYMSDVKRHSPAYVIVHMADLVYDITEKKNDDPWLQLSRLPDMETFVRKHYKIERTIGYLTLFRHID